MTNKTPKKKGFIRWEAIIPTLVFFALIFAYFILFFDTHLRRGMEFAGYSLLGAEVNVDSLKTSFTKASISINGIQITNSEKPSHNLLSIGQIKFDMSWDALLRGKILIEIASIEQIQIDSKRSSPGRVKPPEPKSNEPSFVEKEAQKLSKEALEKAKVEYDDNILGDVASLLSGGNSQEQINNLGSQLKSKARIAEIQTELSLNQTSWNEKLKSLPQQKDIQSWNDRFKNIKPKNPNSPQDIQESLKQLQALLQEADARLKGIQSTGQEFSSNMSEFSEKFKGLDKLVQEDVKELEAHFKIPKLDAKSITHSLFQRYAGPYLEQINKYETLAHKYLPPGLLDKNKKSDEDEAIQARPRSRGISYEYGKQNSYPLFWVKKALISSKATPGIPSAGNLEGVALNITSNQSMIGKPTELKFHGDFPEMEVNGVNAELVLNHIKRPFRESFEARIESYPVAQKMLITGKDLEFGFKKAVGESQVKASYSDKILDFSISNAYKQLDYIVSSSNKEVDGILKSIMSNIPVWKIDASGSGIFPDLPIDLNSNLGAEIARGFERVLQNKIEEAKTKVKKIIDETIGREKAKLESEFNKIKAKVESEVSQITETLNKQKSAMETKIEETKKEVNQKAQKQMESEVKKKVDPGSLKKLEDLKKNGFKF